MPRNPGPSYQTRNNVFYITSENISDYIGPTYAADFGVTGDNDGTRDDAPLLSDAYDAAVANGSNSLILPVGDVWIQSRKKGAVYPYDYVVRILESDFTIVVPEGCTIHDTVTGGGTGSTANDIFQVGGTSTDDIVYRSGVTGGGNFVHESPGYGNNLSCAVHISAFSDQCFISWLSANGLASTGYAVFDNSSSNAGFLINLKVNDCTYGVMQSSTGTAVRGVMSDIYVSKYRGNAITCSGYDNQCVNLTADNEGSGYDAVQNAGFAHQGAIRSLEVTNLRVNGDTSNAGSGAGILIQPSSVIVGGQVVLSQTYARWFNTGLYLIGTGALDVTFQNPTWVECTNMILRQGACGRVYLKGHIRADRYFNGILCAAGSSGDFYIEDVSSTRMQGSGKLFPTTNSPSAYVMQLDNLYSDQSNDTNYANSSLPISLNKRIQRVASAAAVTATAGIDGLTTLLTGTTNTALTTPANPYDGQKWRLRSEGAIGTFSFSGGTVAGAPSALTAGYDREMLYVSAITSWV